MESSSSARPTGCHRNLSKRVEVVTPIFAHGPRKRLWEFLDICLRDQRQAWVLDSEGKYTQLSPEEGDGPEAVGTHQTLMDLTRTPQRSIEAGSPN